MPRAKQRTPEMRERVLQAAMDMLASDGVAEFTTRRLAQRARLARQVAPQQPAAAFPQPTITTRTR